MILWTTIGLLVGLLLGLSGAGGAILAVPLFQLLLDLPLASATTYSLFAVIVGAGLGWISQRPLSHNSLALQLVAGSSVGSLIFSRIKPSLPESALKVLFILVCVFSLVSLWKKKSKRTPPITSSPASDVTGKHLLIGVLLGALITLTGLGGGVLLIPLLSGPLGLPLSHATPTSLLTVFLSAAFSLLFQYYAPSGAVFEAIPIQAIAGLVLGSITAVLVTRELIQRVSVATLDPLRRATVTGVIVLSILTLLLR